VGGGKQWRGIKSGYACSKLCMMRPTFDILENDWNSCFMTTGPVTTYSHVSNWFAKFLQWDVFWQQRSGKNTPTATGVYAQNAGLSGNQG